MITTRFSVARLESKLSAALNAASGGEILAEYQQAADEVNRSVSQKIIASGRGGSHNAEFAKQDAKVTRASSGRYNIAVGWINPPASAAERGSGGRLWYQYQDRGFHLFGGPNWIEGVGATVDRRHDLLEKIEDINYRYVKRIANILEK